jgi:MFS transporter, FHS family, L-fucose permease
MKNVHKINVLILTPVLFSFFVMSFCDLVGIGVDYAKADFQLSNTLAQLIPMAVFVWFFVLSVPIGILQDRIGKRRMVSWGLLITAAGLILPFVWYTFPTLISGFILLGIGNTIIQVSANPLLIDVVPSARRSSFLSFAQFIKAIGSMAAPYLATFFAVRTGNWQLVLLVFGITSLLSLAWLGFTRIEESGAGSKKASFSSSIQLLKVPFIAIMVLAIFFLVGIDVGINSFSGQFLMDHLGMDPEPAMQGRSLYFFGKMLGTFLGALVLTRIASGKFLFYSSITTLVTLIAFILAPSPAIALSMMFLAGMTASNIFPLIFSLTAGKYMDRANEISGLIIMAVSGGAFIPPVAGWLADQFSISAAMYVFVASAIYLVFVALYAKTKSNVNN